MKKGIFLYLIFLILPMLFSGCTTYNPATERNEWIFISDEQEVDIGKGVVKEVSEKFTLLDDSRRQSLVSRTGKKIADVCDRPTLPYEFHVIDDDTVNAFACPGGFVYIHKGLLDKLNQDELAFVLAHEVGHVTARHAVKRIQADLGFQMVISLALLGTGQEQAAALGNISGTVYNLVALGYSREDEMLADKLGIKYASRAAYDPNGGIGALEKLKQEGGSWHVPFLSTHPDIDARIKKAKAEVAALPKK